MVSYTELLSMGSNHIRRRFVTPFSFFLFLSSFRLSFVLFVFFSIIFFICYPSKYISNFQCKKYDMNLKLRLRWLYLSSNLLHHHLLSLRWLFLSKNHLRQIWHIGEVRRLLRCTGCLLAQLSPGLWLPKGSKQRYPRSFSNHRIQCTTLYLGCRLPM